ncbi:MAG TPA: glycosyltransferase family 2 protein [Thermoanaerobaculia bacterium]|nr:glycosyltransferase family 2 protein [Thermoanaerobaculia bacterium]
MPPAGSPMALLGWIVVAYWSLLLLNTLLNLALMRRVRVAPLAREPFVSIVVPARDEERAIERAVRALLAQNYSAFEVIVVDDRSSDATPSILASIGDARLTVVRGEEPPEGWLGKPWALHQGSLRAKGELLLFVDADIHYTPDALRALVGEIETRGTAMLSVYPRLEMHGVWEHAILLNLTMVGFTILPLWISDRAALTHFAIGGGTGNLIRRRDYDAIGGHVSLRAAVIDDVGLARLVRASGRRTELARAEDLISVRMYHGLAESVEGFTKNGFITIGRSYAMLTVSIVALLVFNLLPYALATLWPFALAVVLITMTRVLVCAVLGYALWAALLLPPLQAAIWIYIMLRSAWVTGVRGRVSWRGRTYDASGTRFGG